MIMIIKQKQTPILSQWLQPCQQGGLCATGAAGALINAHNLCLSCKTRIKMDICSTKTAIMCAYAKIIILHDRYLTLFLVTSKCTEKNFEITSGSIKSIFVYLPTTIR